MLLIHRDVLRLHFTVGKANGVGGFRRREQNLGNAQLHGRFHHVVRGRCVDPVAFWIGAKLDARDRSKVNDGVELGHAITAIEVVEACDPRERREDLTGVGQVRSHVKRAFDPRRNKVKVENSVALRDEVSDYVTASFSGTASEQNTH